MAEVLELIVAALIAVVGLTAALVPLYRISRRTETDAKLAKMHASAANDAVNRTHENSPRLADNVLTLLATAERHDQAIEAMQDELVLIRSCCAKTTEVLENVSLKCPMMKEECE